MNARGSVPKCCAHPSAPTGTERDLAGDQKLPAQSGKWGVECLARFCAGNAWRSRAPNARGRNAAIGGAMGAAQLTNAEDEEMDAVRSEEDAQKAYAEFVKEKEVNSS